MKRNYLKGVKLILKFISNMEFMNSNVRQDLEHIQTEPEWETALTIFYQMRKTITLSILWAISDVRFLNNFKCFFKPYVHLKTMKMCLKEMKKKYSKISHFNLGEKKLVNSEFFKKQIFEQFWNECKFLNNF